MTSFYKGQEVSARLRGMGGPRRSMLEVTVVLLIAPACVGETHSMVDVVDPGVEYQVIDNFGASDCWSMQKVGGWSNENKHRVAELLFSTRKGIGLSCWRFNLGGGINRESIRNPWRTVETFEVTEGQYDWTRQANERWFLREAKRFGVRQFVAFVNSPPRRMTRNGLTNCDKGSASTNLKPGHEGQFARYLADILEHFQKNSDEAERIDFDRISPVNEPSWEWLTTCGQEGNRASNVDIKAIVKALHEELVRRGLRTRILVPEARSPAILYAPAGGMIEKHGAAYGDFLKAFCNDPDVGGMLDKTLCYHSYWADLLGAKLVQQRRWLRRAMDRYPGWKLWQTEYCVMEGPSGKSGHGRDLGMETALNVARVIHCDLTIVGVAAWQWWLAASPANYKDGLIYTDYRKPGDPEDVIESKLLWTLGNFSRFIRPGMRRIELQGQGHDVRGLLGSAYKGADGNIVLIYINMARTPRGVTIRIAPRYRGKAIQRLRPYVTSDKAGDDLKPYPAVPLGTEYQVPARTVVTLVGQ